ncbi:universal stress protein [Cerasicoccus fimbriatus]|uniref:universal stress protein n=1 Tax=Cerasicoccus fimbriatus TaxID=3014554 RepID=UPI0022B584E7|nr:universal stress protein [Cerasicoccus sp. TK19100]
MKRYKRIVIPLSLTSGSELIVQWAGKVAQLAGSEQVIFVHPMDIGDIPEKAKEKYPWLAAPLGEQAINEMKTLVEESWTGPENTHVGYRAIDRSSQALAVLEVVVETEADLVIVSRENFGHDLAIRLARKAPCSVMVIPKDWPCQLRNILVSVDFSKHCAHAMDIATAFAQAEGLSSIESLHVYDVGRSAHRVTIPQEELLRTTQEYAAQQHREFVDTLDTKGITVNCQEACNLVAPHAVCYEAQELNCDLIVVGCRGKDTVTALLLGSNAEDMLRLSPVPVIAAKAKGSGMQLLEALLAE